MLGTCRAKARRYIAALVFLGGAASSAPTASLTSQADPAGLRRVFTPGVTHTYRVRLTVRTELEGRRPVQIGARAYAEPFARWADARLEWTAARTVMSVEEGAARIEETLGQFSGITVSAMPPGDEEAAGLRDALEAALRLWRDSAPEKLAYREAADGALEGLPPAAGPALGESGPPLAALWLRRALRPAATLPARALRLGERWQEPRRAELPGWSGVRAFESGEWLDGPRDAEPSIRLHITQQITGKGTQGQGLAGSAEGAEERFHAESLATLALGGGRVMAATRSAARETSWTVEAPGLGEPARFRGRLTLHVHIEEVR